MTTKSVLMSLASHQAMVKECEHKSAQLLEVMAELDNLAADYADLATDRDKLQTELLNTRKEREQIAALIVAMQGRVAQADPVQCLANLRADAIKQAAQKALDAAQVPLASPIRADYFKAGVRCCAAALVEYAEKVRGGKE